MSKLTEHDNSTDFDVLMSYLGLDKEKPKVSDKPPEERLLNRLSQNGFRYWMRSRMFEYEFMIEDGVQLTIASMHQGVPTNVAVNRAAHVKRMLEYYLLSSCRNSFDKNMVDKDYLCDFNKVRDILLSWPDIKSLIVRSAPIPDSDHRYDFDNLKNGRLKITSSVK